MMAMSACMYSGRGCIEDILVNSLLAALHDTVLWWQQHSENKPMPVLMSVALDCFQAE